MNLMGMGISELGVVLLVAFLVLGPSRAIDMARNVGKVIGDLRRSFGDVTTAMTVDTMEQRSPVRSQEPEPPPGVPMRAETPPEDEPAPESPVDDSNVEAGSKSESGDKG